MVSNITNSQNNVVTTLTMVLSKFIDIFSTELDGLNIVYDENLEYESALRKYRSDNNLDGSSPVPYPLLAIRRSVLRHATDRSPSKRMGRMLVSNTVSNEVSQEFRSVHGEIDLEFLYINNSISDVEKFEIVYSCQEGISNFTQIDVNLPEEYGGGSLPYFAMWEDLEDKKFEFQDTFHKMIAGKVTIVGHYLTFRTDNNRILEINLKINNLVNGNNIENITIEPT